MYIYDVYFFLPDEYDRTALNATSDTCRPDIRSRRSVYPSVNLPATAVKISICGNGRGRLSVDRSGNRLVTAGLAEISR